MLHGAAKLAAVCTSVLVLSALGVAASAAQSVEEFYRGKQVRFIIHSAPGGAYDMWARITGTYLTKYLPGNPVFIPQNMPGAGGITAANFLYSQAPRDGSVIGMVGRNIPSQAALKIDNITLDPRKFNWIGNPEMGATVCVVSIDGAASAEDAFKKEVIVGGAGAGTAVSTMPIVLNNLLGTKFKVIEGYGSQSAITLAIERGEVHGSFATLTSVQTSFPGALKNEGKMRVLFNLERTRVPGLNAPSIFEFAKTDEDRQLLGLLSVSSEVGRPMLMPPEVPADRVAAMRAAFDASMKDPKLLAEAQKAGLPIDNVVSGKELEKIIDDLMATPQAVIEKMKSLTGGAGM